MAESQIGHAAHSKKAEVGIRDQVERPIKLVFLGAGSFFFRALFTDVLGIPGADKGEVALVDVDPDRLELSHKLAETIIAKSGRQWSVTSSADRRKVLAGSDYIVNCIEVFGLEAVKTDYEIPLKYGVDQCIGDTVGPGGLFKALRTVPVWLEVLKDIEALCPGAYVLNYTNPMSIMCLASARTSSAKVFGLCHSVQGTSKKLAGYLDVPYHEMQWKCGGINHMAFFTELNHNGKDLYPALFEKARNGKEIYEQDPVRFDIMLHFGHFVTESSGHFSEYLPYYRKRKELIEKYCRDGYRGESGFYSHNWPQWRADFVTERKAYIDGSKELPMDRSWEYASWIIQAIETNAPVVAYCSVPNRGLISNLPADGVVETACLVNASGITPTRFDGLPPQCAALCDWNMRMFDLAATACIDKSREAAAHALMLDPLTAAVCCPAEIKAMTEEMFEAQRELLPGF